MPVLALLVLSPIGAELLAAYNDTTGRPLALLGNLVFFAALYGCPALLIRELARRTGGGWPAILLLSAAAGLLQAGVLDQSLFSESYDDVRGWEESVRATYVEPLGLSAYMAQNFILGHVIFSFAAPIALAEAVGAARAVAAAARAGPRGARLAGRRRAAGRRHERAARDGGGVAGDARGRRRAGRGGAAHRPPPATRSPRSSVGLLGLSPNNSTLACTAPLATAPASSPRRARGAQLRASAPPSPRASCSPPRTRWRPRRGPAPPSRSPSPRSALVLLARHAWTLEHVAAIATGALLARGALAFTYYPVVGETSAAQKYAHNVVMLAVVAAAGAYSCAAARRRPLPA